VEASCHGREARPKEGFGMSDAPAPVTMAFTHLCAWRVIGGIGMPADASSISLASDASWSYSLTKDIDAVCADSDRGLALSHLVLQGIFGPEKIGTLDERLAAEIVEIREARRRRAGGWPLLLFQGTGALAVTIGKSFQQHAGFILTFDAFDKGEIRQRYVHQHRAMQLALALESKTRIRYEEVTAGTYCTDAAGHTVYSLTFSGGTADVTVSSPLSPDGSKAVADLFAVLTKSAELESTVRLFADMADYGREPFRVFISGWAALEILIKKTFKDYEERFFSKLAIPHQRDTAVLFLDRIRKTMGDKHNLVDRFTLVSSVLLPSQSAAEADADLATFKRIKQQRDEIAHGVAFDERQLRVSELSNLLMKYLAAHARSHP
jgi:hypothetical protein